MNGPPSLDALSLFGARRRLPLILQTEGAECGLACLAMIAARHGFDSDLATLRRRDPKGLYARAEAGQIAGLTGVAAPYEAPEQPDLRLDTREQSVERCGERVEELLLQRGSLAFE